MLINISAIITTLSKKTAYNFKQHIYRYIVLKNKFHHIIIRMVQKLNTIRQSYNLPLIIIYYGYSF